MHSPDTYSNSRQQKYKSQKRTKHIDTDNKVYHGSYNEENVEH